MGAPGNPGRVSGQGGRIIKLTKGKKREAFPKLQFLGMAHEPVDKNPFMIGRRVEPAYESLVRDTAVAVKIL
jgi:hypothetical protein